MKQLFAFLFFLITYFLFLIVFKMKIHQLANPTIVGLVSLFNDLSTFVAYSKLKPSL